MDAVQGVEAVRLSRRDVAQHRRYRLGAHGAAGVFEQLVDEGFNHKCGAGVGERRGGYDVDVFAELVGVLLKRLANHVGVAAFGQHDLVFVRRHLHRGHVGVVEVAFGGLAPVREREAIERPRVARVDDNVLGVERRAHVVFQHDAASVGVWVSVGASAAVEDLNFDGDVAAVGFHRALQWTAGAGVFVPGCNWALEAAG